MSLNEKTHGVAWLFFFVIPDVLVEFILFLSVNLFMLEVK